VFLICVDVVVVIVVAGVDVLCAVVDDRVCWLCVLVSEIGFPYEELEPISMHWRHVLRTGSTVASLLHICTKLSFCAAKNGAATEQCSVYIVPGQCSLSYGGSGKPSDPTDTEVAFKLHTVVVVVAVTVHLICFFTYVLQDSAICAFS